MVGSDEERQDLLRAFRKTGARSAFPNNPSLTRRIAMGLFDFVKDIGKKLFGGKAEFVG